MKSFVKAKTLVVAWATLMFGIQNGVGQSITHPYAPKNSISASDQQASSSDLAGKRGLHNVDAFSGGFGYSVPIVCPPARNSSQPTLSLVYSSGGENGWCGVGWRLHIGFIERNLKDGFPMVYSGNPPAPTTSYDDSKSFILNLFGKEHKLVRTAIVGANHEYRPEVDTDFIRCVLDTTNNKWQLYDTAGNIFYFAKNADLIAPAMPSKSRVSNPNWSGYSGTFHWALDEIHTVTGDQTVITYDTFNNPEGRPERTIYPKDITYNGHVNLNNYAAAYTGQHRIIFQTEARPDRRFSYRWGFRTEQNRRLSSITMQIGPIATPQNVTKYELKYQIGAGAAVSTATKRSLLRTITVSGWNTDPLVNNWESLPVQTFTYQQASTPASFATSSGKIQWKNLNLTSTYPGVNDYEISYAQGFPPTFTLWDIFDIDGDGLPDRVMYDDVPKPGQGSKRFYQVQRNIGLQADGHGSFGVRNANGTTSSATTEYLWGPVSSGGGSSPSDSNLIPDIIDWAALNGQRMRIRDINGDGLPDRVCDYWGPFYTLPGDFTPNNVFNTPYDKFVIMLNNGAGFSTTAPWSVHRGPHDALSITEADLGLYATVESGGVNTGLFDINGDGLPDRVLSMYPTEGAMTYFRVQFNNGSSFGPITKFGPYYSQNYNVGPAAFSGFGTYPAYYWAGIETPEVHMIDINGDGLLDRVMYPRDATTPTGERAAPTSEFFVEFNNGYAFEAMDVDSIVDKADPWGGVVSQTGVPRYDAILNYPYVGMHDVNGDGLPDRVVQNHSLRFGTGTFPYDGTKKGWLVYMNNGRSFDNTPTPVEIYDPTGSTLDSDPSVHRPWWSPNGILNSGQTVSSLIDMNGDGLLDRIVAVSNGTSPYFYVQLNTALFPDLLTGIENGIGGVITVAYKSSTAYDNRSNTADVNSGSRLPLAVQVVSTIKENDGINGDRTTTYSYEGGFYDASRREFAGFAKVSITDNANRKMVYFFHQGGGRDFGGTSGLGEFSDSGAFAKKGMPFRVETYGNDGKKYQVVVNQVHQVNLPTETATPPRPRFFPFVQRSLIYDYPGDGTPKITSSKSDYTAAADTYTYRLNKRTSYGKVTVTDLGIFALNDEVTADTQYFHTSYATITGNANILDHPSIVKLTSDDAGATIVQETKYFYNATSGTLSSEQSRICAGQYSVTSRGTYNTYGLATIFTDPAGVQIRIDYDTTYNIFPVTNRVRAYAGVNSTSDHVTSSTFDFKSGLVLTSKDPMGVSVRNFYDVFFRVKERFKTPIGESEFRVQKVDYALAPISSGVSSSYVHSRSVDGVEAVGQFAGGHESRTYFDGFGRPIQTRTEREDQAAGLKYRVVSMAYNEQGTVFLTTWPRFEAALTSFVKPTAQPASWVGFDALGRVSETRKRVEASFDATGKFTSKSDSAGDATSPVGVEKWTYQKAGDPWWIEYSDEVASAASIKSRRYGLDAFGRTNAIEEINGGVPYTTTLGYDLVGNLTTITDSTTPDPSVIRYGYDDIGNVVVLADPHLGLWTYRRDKAGRLREQVDGKGQKVEYLYEAPHNRLSQKTVYNSAGQMVNAATYGYDTGISGYTVYKGLPSVVWDSEGWERYGYDTRGRLQKVTRHLNVNGKDYLTTYEYDNADHVTKVVYPNSGAGAGPTINYSYHHGGRLKDVSRPGSSAPYIFYTTTASDFDEAGRVLKYTFGNGLINSRNYYPTSKRLSSITAGPSGSLSSVLNKTYQYTVAADVSNISGTAITYDALHRVTGFAGLAGSYAYDQLGNIITSIEGSGPAYNYGSARKQAVKTAFGSSYMYDKCGNMIVRKGNHALQYDSENRLTRYYNPGVATVEYGYGPDGARLWKRKNLTDLQIWIGDIYEERDGETLFHVFAGGQRIATFETGSALAVDGGGGNTTHVGYYYHQDHLGSSSVLSDSAGVSREVNVWYPFGRGTPGNPVQSKVSNQFTGQVKDDETGLYYYGARYYDPELGRFIQADTIIPDLANPQSYNRYSYVINNPLKYVDPTGHAIETPNDLWNVGLGISSLTANAWVGNVPGAFVDIGGLLYDGFATGTPGLPAFAGTAIRARRASQALNASTALKINKAIDAAIAEGKISTKTFKIPDSSIAAKKTVQHNKVAGDAWEAEVLTDHLPLTQTKIETQVTIKSLGPSGKRVRLDALGTEDLTGAIKLTDPKGSPTAPLTKNQKVVYPEMETHGGVVVGKGKGAYPGGTVIPPTKVDIIRKQ